ncbi:MAG: agmatine deiminase family protein [Immundisolibacter sp.]|uniref:agmatine deiminase family protein n=1 Tax=Immundisolibacter sp. TaxID=1934948 RepID=UPI003EDEB5DA
MTAFAPGVLPSEWAPQAAVLLTWPHAYSDWADTLHTTETEFVGFAAAIAQREPLIVACHDEDHRRHVADRLARTDAPPARLTLAIAPSNDVWVRDHGPLTVLRGRQRVALDFGFNGWGGKYRAELDDAVTRTLANQDALGDIAIESVPWVLEGGNLEVDGEGTLLATRPCLMSETRNDPAAAQALLAALPTLLGVQRLLWVDRGDVLGDDTDGHIDTLARFCDAHTLAYTCADPADREQHTALDGLEEQLKALRQADGRPYQLVPLPVPAPLHDDDGRRLPANYANFLIINGAVLVPTYDDPHDALALDRLAGCFAGRTVVPVPARAIVGQNGSLHCASMQIPAAP